MRMTTLHKAAELENNLRNATNILQSVINGTTTHQLAQVAVNALNQFLDNHSAALAQEPAQPVATLHSDGYWTRKDTEAGRAFNEHIRTIARADAYLAAPQPKPAVQEPHPKRLTNEQIVKIFNDSDDGQEFMELAIAIGRNLEKAVLGEKMVVSQHGQMV